ncbi:MAG: ABC transporter ATP-binding protein [Acidobacteria bacterium]|nr:ABC transporter ATP-binding protein [Acidobacteriota bacterium]
MSLLEAKHLTKRFAVKRNLFGRVTEWFTAVDDVSFTVEQGETLALVGESGAGKSTTGRMALRLIEPDMGEVRFEGEDLLALDGPAMRKRRQDMQMIFQDPFSSLAPHRTIGEAVAEPLLVHFGMGSKERLAIAAGLLDRVGLSAAVRERYPSELSGGQLQRVAIARALTLEPKLIVCDEPVAALDVSVRAQVLNLMHDLQAERKLAYLFVSHDLALVEVIADRVAVMSHGRIVEEGPSAELFRSPKTEYTAELLSAVPRPVPRSLRAPATTLG